jgi:hypothetical protein
LKDGFVASSIGQSYSLTPMYPYVLSNVESMLQLRLARANEWWDAYWQSPAN